MIPEDSVKQKANAWRAHCFWHCPVAKAVVKELTSVLPANTSVTCQNIWILHCPCDSVHSEVWALVCMVALEVMNYGRKAMWAMYQEQRRGSQPAGLAVCDHAARKAAILFWGLLQDFVSLNIVPSSWLGLTPLHPFIGVQLARGGTSTTSLKLNLPAGMRSQEDVGDFTLG